MNTICGNNDNDLEDGEIPSDEDDEPVPPPVNNDNNKNSSKTDASK